MGCRNFKYILILSYPFERAEALSKEIKKLGVFEDGKTFLDKFRILITQVGNALG